MCSIFLSSLLYLHATGETIGKLSPLSIATVGLIMTRTVSSSSPSSFRPIEDAATSSIGAMWTGPCQDIWYNNTIMQARITNIVADEMAVAAVMRGVLDAATNQEDNDASLVTTTPEELQEKVRVVSPDPSKKAITKETTNVVSIGGEKNKKPQRRNTQKKAVVPRRKTKPAAPLKKTKKTPKRGQVPKNKASMEDEKKLSPRHFLPGDKTYVDAPTAFDILVSGDLHLAGGGVSSFLSFVTLLLPDVEIIRLTSYHLFLLFLFG